MQNIIEFLDIDKIIVLSFLVITLIVGIISGKGIKNIREYAIANKEYGTPVILITLLATVIGGGATTGEAAQIFQDGIIYVVASSGYIIALFLFAYFIAPQFNGRFEGMISISDIVKSFYGPYAEKVSSFVGYIFCLCVLAIQLTAMGYIISSILDASYRTSVFITAGLVITYSTFGGIKSVTMTDVLQFIILVVMLPLIASVATTEVGGLGSIFNHSAAQSHMQIFGHPKFEEYVALFIFGILPFQLFVPYVIQRFLMARNQQQIKKITTVYFILQFPLIFLITCIAFAALKLFPDAEPKAIIPLIIDSLLPPIIKGLAIAGMLAVIMSTADSALNSAGIVFIHNLIPKHFFRNEAIKLYLIKICTFVTGVLAVVIALQNYNILHIYFTAMVLSVAANGIPLLFGIISTKVIRISFWTCNIFAVIAFIVAKYLGIAEFSIPIITTTIGIIGYFIPYIIKCQNFTLKPKDEHSSSVSKRSFSFFISNIKNYLPTFQNIYLYSKTKVEKFGANSLMFGIFCCINYVVPYFMWTYQKPTQYPIMLGMRLIAGLLCVGLLMKDYWPARLKKYFPLYWHFTLIYCLPFVTTTMFLIMEAHIEWLINLTLAIMLLTMLVDWMSFMLISVIGTAMGYLFYRVIIGVPDIPTDFATIYHLVYIAIFATLIGLLFARRKEIDNEEKLEAMRLFGSAIAHEVKSPLATINMCAQHLEMTLAQTDTGHTINTASIKPTLNRLYELIGILSYQNKQGIKTVDTLLTSLKSNVCAEDNGVYSVSECLKQALFEYAPEDPQQDKLKVNITQDIKFYGSFNFMKHVFFNLIKNAYTHTGNNNIIEIWTKGNTLHFKDYGKGIANEDLPYIFDKFYTNSKHGTGIGLAFCKMVMEELDGSISCNSELGKYTEFVLEFPILAKNGT